MNREEIEQQARRLIHLRREREEIGVVTDMSLGDKKKAIAALPRKLRAEALGEAQTLLGRLSPGDELRPGDVQNLVAAVVAEQVFTLLGEALEAAPADSHGRYDLTFLTRRREELDGEITRLEADMQPNLEGGRLWFSGRIAIRPGTLEPFDSLSGLALRGWNLEAYLQQIGPGPEPEEEQRRGPGRPKKIAAGTYKTPEEMPI